ncbi:MAG: hypothetical protein ACJAUP_003429 [Cellvibrionaceae bacterium]|jgi:hypothetical protein
MSKVEVNARGIKNRLKDVKPYRAIAEYIWNGFDSGANTVDITFECSEIGDIHSLNVEDNGKGIPFSLLENKFTPVLSSEKREQQVQHTLLHGKNGLGRLTFYHFAQAATWNTCYEENGSLHAYSIHVDESKIDHYDPSEVIHSDKENTGTLVKFHNIFDLSEYGFRSNIQEYLKKEFAWLLELKKGSGFAININGEPLNCNSLKKDVEKLELNISGNIFLIDYVRWSNKLNRHFSRFYCSSNNGVFRYSKPTTLNNKGDEFYHSVFVTGQYFDEFKVGEMENQGDLLTKNSDQSDVFKSLVSEINGFLRNKRKPFIVSYAKTLVEEYEKNGIFPKFNAKNRWEVMRSEDLREAVAQLYQVEPRIFSNLNTSQKKTMVGFLSLIIDGGDINDLFRVLDGVIELSSSEREIFSKQLTTTKMSSIVKTIELISDRYKSVAEFKRLVFDSSMYAGEVPHLQKMMEKNYWLIGEEYQLLTAAEPDFEEALRRFLYVLHGATKKPTLKHKDKNKEMDLFLIRQDKRNSNIENIVLELKHPVNVRLGKKEIDQVYNYFSIIRSESRFNASNMKWRFYLIGNKFDGTGYIEGLIKSLQVHGEPGLAYTSEEYKVYVHTWSEIFNEFELRHDFLNQKLKLERDRLTEIHDSADDIVSKIRSSDANPEVSIPAA